MPAEAEQIRRQAVQRKRVIHQLDTPLSAAPW